MKVNDEILCRVYLNLFFHEFFMIKVEVLVTQLCPTLCDPMDCGPPGFFVLGILQARILEWAVIPFFRGSNLPTLQADSLQSLDQEDPLEKQMATCSSILAWRIPRTEEPGGLQSTGSQIVRDD